MIELRCQSVSDAERFCEILDNPNFKYFPACPSSVEAERAYIRQNEKWRELNLQYDFSIVKEGRVIGAIGLHISHHRPHVGEIGYFVEEAYWNQGVATQALRLLEKQAFTQLNLQRIEIYMTKKNKASRRVALKCGYKKEGVACQKISLSGVYYDAYVFVKVASK